MIVIGITQIQSYVLIAEANGYVMGKSPTAPSPYAVWQIDDDGEGVSCGHYFVDREEAEWDFCARAFEWFEDNMYIHVIEDERPLENDLVSGLRTIRNNLTTAARLVDEMCAEMDKLKERRHNENDNEKDKN